MNLHANGKIKRQNAWRSAKRLTRSEMLLAAAVLECMCAIHIFIYGYERICTHTKQIYNVFMVWHPFGTVIDCSSFHALSQQKKRVLSQPVQHFEKSIDRASNKKVWHTYISEILYRIQFNVIFKRSAFIRTHTHRLMYIFEFK